MSTEALEGYQVRADDLTLAAVEDARNLERSIVWEGQATINLIWRAAIRWPGVLRP